MRLIALLVVLVPVLLLRSGVAFADDPAGVEAQDMVWAEPIEFPPDTVMFIGSGCFQCDGNDRAIYRFSRSGQGPVRMDEVVSPAKLGGSNISGFVASADGSRLAASLWDHGHCAGGPSPNCFGHTVFQWSDDGGVTWREILQVPDDGPVDSASPQVEVVAISGGDVIYRDHEDFFVYEAERGSSSKLSGPDADRLIMVKRSKWDGPSQTLSIDNGATKIVVPVGFPPQGWIVAAYENGPDTVILDDAHPPLVHWQVAELFSRQEYLTAYVGGTLRGVKLEGLLGTTAHWLDEHYLAGTFFVAWEPCSGCQLLATRPALLDLEAGVAYPIRDLLTPSQDFGLLGRTAIRGVARGPFLRVQGPECLPVRAWADAFASVTACAAQGVLLRPLGGVRYEHGAEWREVSLPNGTTGWVPRTGVGE